MRWILLFFMLLYNPLWGQSYGGLSIDNDLFFGKDYYYSSGIFLQYGTTKNGREKPLKNEDLFSEEKAATRRIHWTLGQQIYNPIGRYDSITTSMDYPFSGYLFLERAVSKTLKNKGLFRWSAQLGISGPGSLSEPFQNTYHKYILGLPPLSWVGQQPGNLHIGLLGQYTNYLSLGQARQFSYQIQSQWGTHSSQSSVSGGFHLGQINPMVFYSEAFHHPTKEGFGVYIGLQYRYHFQDYNLSGSLFENNSPFTLPSNSWRNTWLAGMGYQINQWQFLAVAKARSKDTPGQKYQRHQVVYLSILRQLD